MTSSNQLHKLRFSEEIWFRSRSWIDQKIPGSPIELKRIIKNINKRNRLCKESAEAAERRFPRFFLSKWTRKLFKFISYWKHSLSLILHKNLITFIISLYIYSHYLTTLMKVLCKVPRDETFIAKTIWHMLSYRWITYRFITIIIKSLWAKGLYASYLYSIKRFS